MIIFGDSLSDTGNIASSIDSLPFPYYKNRISNGPVAVEELTNKLGFNAAASLHLFGGASGYNYAVAGGKISGNDAEDLGTQISAFLNRVNFSADSHALYVLMLGGNDLRSIRGTTFTAHAEAQIESTVAVYLQQIMRLYNAGAKHFLVANAPNIGRIPETLNLESSFPGITTRARNYTQNFNQRLNARLKSLSLDKDSYVIGFDFYSTFEDLINNPNSYGLNYTDVACFTLSPFSFHPNCNFSKFVFFDNIHPTAKAHQIVGEAMYNHLVTAEAKLTRGPVVSPIFLLLLSDQ